MKKITVEPNYKKYLYVTLCLTLHCNFNCWYCYQKNWDQYGNINYKDFIEFIKQVQKNYPDKTIIVPIIGGEALFHKDIDQLLLELYKLNIKVDITTNGSKSITWWDKFAGMIDNITLSYHHNEIDKNDFFNACKHIIKFHSFRHITVALMIEKEYFDEIYEFGQYIVNNLNNIIVSMKPIRINGIQQNYTNEQYEKLKKQNKLRSKNIINSFSPFGKTKVLITDQAGEHLENINQFMLLEKYKFKGYLCNVGIDVLYVNQLGEVFGSYCMIGGSYGNISNHVNFPDTPIICNKDICDCRDDLTITKWYNNHSREKI